MIDNFCSWTDWIINKSWLIPWMTFCSVHHMSQGNGPVPLQVGIRITSKSTYVVLLNRSTPESESYARVSLWTTPLSHPAGRSLFWLERDNNYDCTDQPVCQFDCRDLYTGQYGRYRGQGQQIELKYLTKTTSRTFGWTHKLISIDFS